MPALPARRARPGNRAAARTGARGGRGRRAAPRSAQADVHGLDRRARTARGRPAPRPAAADHRPARRPRAGDDRGDRHRSAAAAGRRRRGAAAVTETFSASFDPALESPALARHELEGWLPPTLTEDDRGALRLLVSELVTNSIRHVAGSAEPVQLLVRIDAGAIRVEVRDGGAGFEPGKPEPRGADGGFGLFLVERMASRWGVETRNGTIVWFELDIAPGGR